MSLKPAKPALPGKRAFINVNVLDKTRKSLAKLKKITGLKTQGDVIDYMVADVMRRRPKD